MRSMLTIGKAAARAALSVDAIRFYEREGLLAPARKTKAGYRLYDEDALRRIRFIRQAQACGFSLAEIRELLALRRNDGGCCEDVRKVAIEKKLEVERRIRSLRAMSTTLSELIAICNDASRPLEDCPILAAFEADSRNISSPKARNGGRTASR